MATRTVGPSGRDFTTINAAIQASNDNPASRGARDLILVDYATYTEVLDFQSPSGGWQIPCIVRAADPNNRPIIQSTGGAQACLGGGAYRGTAVGETELDGLIFSGWTAASNGVCYFSIEGIIIENCSFTGCTNRICIRWIGGSATRYGRAEACTFATSGRSGTGSNGTILTWTAYSDVQNCKAVCPTNVQFQNSASTGPRLVAHNSVVGTWDTGGNSKVMVGAAGTYRGNLIQNLGTGGSHAIETAGTYTENIAYGTFTTRFSGTDGGSNQNVDPQFTNAAGGDLALQVTSPAIRSLSRDASVLYDILGAARSDPTDAGAYETTLSTTVSAVTAVSSTSVTLDLASVVTSDGSWTTAGNYTITPPGGAPSITVSAAVITDSDTITLTTNEHLQGGSYTLAWSGLTNITNGSSGYTGIGVAPTLSWAAATTHSTVTVTFSEDMTNNAALTTAGNYTLTRSGGSTAVASVSRTNATTVVLTCATPLWSGYTYTLSVSGPTDLAGNAASATTTAFAPLTAVLASVTHAATTTVVLTFGPCATHASMAVTGNYTITRVAPYIAPAAPTVSSAVAAQVGSTLVITLTTTDHFNSQDYRVTWSGLTGVADSYVEYVGVGPQTVVTVSGGFFPPTVKVYTAVSSDSPSGRKSRTSLTGWTEATIARVSDTELSVVLPTNDAGVQLDLMIDAGTTGAYRRSVKRYAYLYS